MRVEFEPTLVEGLEIGLFRMMQLGGEGRPQGLSIWVDAFLTRQILVRTREGTPKEPGNQLAGLDLRWNPSTFPLPFTGKLRGG